MAMHSDEEIVNCVGIIRRWGDSRDPFVTAKELGVRVIFRDLGKLKGMYTVILRNRFIAINENLDAPMRRIVCAHELGHDTLHRELATDSFLHEYMLYEMTSRIEYEANIFAAELLLDDSEIVEFARCGYTAEQIAVALSTDVNLIAIKIQAMQRKDPRFRSPERRANFLK